LLCFGIGNSGKIFASGSDIGVVNLYKSKVKDSHVEHACTFNGHSNAVLCIAVNDEFGILVSGSSDHSVIIWDINRLKYVRSIKHGGEVTAIAVSSTMGDIATFSVGKSDGNILSLFGINGVLIEKKELTEPVTCMKFTNSEYSQYT
jgi:beige protein homolog 1